MVMRPWSMVAADGGVLVFPLDGWQVVTGGVQLETVSDPRRHLLVNSEVYSDTSYHNRRFADTDAMSCVPQTAGNTLLFLRGKL
jgi:hypothetical protein